MNIGDRVKINRIADVYSINGILNTGTIVDVSTDSSCEFDYKVVYDRNDSTICYDTFWLWFRKEELEIID